VRVVVALGGNAILPAGAPRGTAGEQRAAIRVAAEGLAGLVAAGHELVVTHGNGPQVGRLMVQQRAAEIEVVPQPLDVLGRRRRARSATSCSSSSAPPCARPGSGGRWRPW